MEIADSGTVTFTDPADYQASVGGTKIDFVFANSNDFKARLTWVKLPHAYLLRAQENVPRIGLVSLAPQRLFVGIPERFDLPAIWGGIELQRRDIVFQRGGERVYQWTSGASRWSFLTIEQEHFTAFAKALTGRELVLSSVGQIIRPSLAAAAPLRRLHAKALHLAETKPEFTAHPEVARALEHDLLHALVDCLTAAELRDNATALERHARIVIRFEDELAVRIDQPVRLSQVCAALGVPERTLRVCCAQFLGISPTRYLRLRRLNMVRAALRQADRATASVAEIARRHGFSEPGRFAVAYRTVFKETPSTTLQRARPKVRDA